MKRLALAVLALPLLAACGSSSPPVAPQPIEQEAAPSALPSPSQAQFDEAQRVADQLGCVGATPRQGGGNAIQAGSVTVRCDHSTRYPSAQGFGISVYPDEASADMAIQQVRQYLQPTGVQMGAVYISVDGSDDEQAQTLASDLGAKLL